MRIFMVGMSNDKGGVETYIQNLCAYLSKEAEVIYCWPEMKINGKRWTCPLNRHNYIKYLWFWTDFFRENRFDVIYFNTCDIVGVDQLKIAKKTGVPIRIIHSHNTNNQVELNVFHRLEEKLHKHQISKIATHLFACSESAGKWMFPNNRFLIIQNGISLERYQFNETTRDHIRKQIGINSQRLIACIGRLDPQKNPTRTVEIMSAVLRKTENCVCVIIGDGELRQEVDNKIRKIGLQDRIKMLGAKDDISGWYSAADCVIMPSLFEGLPFVLVEAQAAGLPCVVSSTVSREADLTGLVEFVDLEESDEVWADKILSVCGKPRPDTRQQLIDAGYSIEDTAKTVSEIITRALEEHNAEKSH